MKHLVKTNKLLRGDTIVEVLIAMAVLGLVLASAFAISSRSYATGLSARERSEALEIAESQLELLRVASNSVDDSLLDMADPLDPRLFCVDSNAADLVRIDFQSGVTVAETQGLVDPIIYPTDCQLGTDDRYKVSINESPLLDASGVATEGKIFSVRVRWQSIVGNNIDEVNHEYRTYKFGGSLSLGSVPVPAPAPDVPGCTDTSATNYNPSATTDDGSCTYPPPPDVPGCTDSTALNYDALATTDDGSCTYPYTCPINPSTGINYALGDIGPGGGRVFYTRSTPAASDWCYLESATVNQGNATRWNCTFLDNMAFGIGFGKENTDTITSNCSGANNPAVRASNYTGGGLNDWFLPSYSELRAMHTNRSSIGGTFSNAYWSSSIFSAPYGYDFNSGFGYLSTPSSSQDYVRAVRRF